MTFRSGLKFSTLKQLMSKYRDGINFLSKFTTRRAWNALLIVKSYIFSRVTKKAIHQGMPISLSFEPTTSCNLRCPECPSGLRSFTRPTGMLSDELYKNTIDELTNTLLYLLFYFQGEPYLHPQFLELVKYASSKKIYTATSTNAHYLTSENARKTVESGLDRLIISIDGTTQETYEAYRIGGSLDKVVEGAKQIIHWKRVLKSKTPHVIFQFLVVKPNEHQVADVRKLAKNIGVDDVLFKTAQIYDFEGGSPFIPEQNKYSRYAVNDDGTYRIKNKLLDHCWKMWHSCVVTWDGQVVPCCFDKDAHHVMGNLSSTSFSELWKGKGYEAFRQKIIVSRSNIEMCQNCTEGSKVWA